MRSTCFVQFEAFKLSREGTVNGRRIPTSKLSTVGLSLQLIWFPVWLDQRMILVDSTIALCQMNSEVALVYVFAATSMRRKLH